MSKIKSYFRKAIAVLSNKSSVHSRYWQLVIYAILLIVAMLISFLVIPHVVINRRLDQNNQKLLGVYTRILDDELSGVRERLTAFSISDPNAGYLTRAGLSEIEKYQYTRSLTMALRDEVNISPAAAVGFAVVPSQSGKVLAVFSESISFSQRQMLQEYFNRHAQGSHTDRFPENWFAVTLGDTSYLIHALYGSSGVYYACIDAEQEFRINFPIYLDNESYLLLTDSKDQLLIHRDLLEKNRVDFPALLSLHQQGRLFGYHLAETQSGESGFRLYALQPREYMLRSMAPLSLSLLVGVFAVLIYLVGLIVSLRRSIFQQISHLSDSVRRICSDPAPSLQDTETDYMEFREITDLFRLVNRNLNETREKYYKKIIDEQMITLQYRQLQIRPHFLCNSLNTVCTLIKLGKTAVACEFCECLISYFRFLLTDIRQFVLLRKEIEHLKNYIHIQELYLADRFSILYDVDDDVLDCEIPPLILHTFLENAIKYAQTEDEPLFMCLKAQRLVVDNEPYLMIRFSDTGGGFSPEALAYLSQDSLSADTGNTHIGLRNVKHRLYLIYGEKASVRFYNLGEAGACNELMIPVGTAGEESV